MPRLPYTLLLLTALIFSSLATPLPHMQREFSITGRNLPNAEISAGIRPGNSVASLDLDEHLKRHKRDAAFVDWFKRDGFSKSKVGSPQRRAAWRPRVPPLCRYSLADSFL